MDNNFDVISCSSSQNSVLERWKRGQGGIALFLKKNLKAKEIQTSCDRIVSASFIIGTIKTVVVSVYLPSTNHNLTDYLITLSELEQFCIQQKSYGFNLILLGDFNAHLSEPNLQQRLNKRGLKLQEFCDSLHLTPVNVSPVCKNPQFTYFSRTGNSIVDYVIIDDALLKILESVERSSEHPDNTVFHLPLKICLFNSDFNRIPKDTEKSNNIKDKIAWKRCTVEQLNRYQEHLNSLLSSVVREGNLPDVNDFYEELINSIKKADQILPRVKFKSYIKPFWNEELKVLRKSVMAARAEWKQAGSPRQRSSILYMKYKKLKCEYRREQRRAIWEFQRKEFNEIGNTQDLDNEKFWRLINNKARGKNKKGKDMSLEVDGEFITDPKQMADLWANYFETLATPLKDNRIYDQLHKKDIEKQVNDIIQKPDDTGCILNVPLASEEIYEVIRSLPNGKAPGFDGITYEHLKFGGEIVVRALLKLYTCIIDWEEIPNLFKLAIKIPILKSNKKTHTFDDHRGISLLSSINKVLERIVLLRLKDKPNCRLHLLQGGYQEQQDALTSCFVIDEVINHCCEDNDNVYVAYMDISKAFDTMWINGMLHKLYYNMGVTGKMWRIIRNWYTNMKEFVVVGGKSSRVYEVSQGTRQGGVLSPWLFLVFINDLIEELNNITTGVFINGVYFGSPMFADDLTMLSRMKSGLEKMLECAWDYSIKWRFTFNSMKTIILTFGETKWERSVNQNTRNWKLGSQIISERERWCNLGKIWHTNKDSSPFVTKAVSNGRDAGMVLVRMGARYGGLNPVTAAGLWRRIGIPRMVYGCELWQINSHDISELEKVQNITLRIMQGFLPGTSGSASRGLLGLLTIEAEIDRRKLYFLGRLILMSYGIACRRIFLVRLTRWKWNSTNKMKGFLPDIVRILHKYDLMDILTEYILLDRFPSKYLWKKIVREHVYAHHNRQWQDKINSHEQLAMFAEIHPVNEVSPWWLLADKNPDYLEQINDVLRLLCGSFKIRVNRVNRPEVYSDHCDICNNDYVNPVEHVLLHCSGTGHLREELWEWINDIMPIETAIYLANLTDREFLLVILGKRLEEVCANMSTWTQLLLKFANFVSKCYRNTIFSI